jgi:hypothetical protein
VVDRAARHRKVGQRQLTGWSLTREVEDASARVLRARLEGDLVGWSEWQVAADRDGTLVHFREKVELGRPGWDGRAMVVRSIVSANHWFMTRGASGLREHFERRT